MNKDSELSSNWTKRAPRKLRCNCKHEFQDKMYGQGIRVHSAIKENAGHEWRCSVCGAER